MDESDPLPQGDPKLIAEGSMPFDPGEGMYLGIISSSTTAALVEWSNYHLFVVADFGDRDKTPRKTLQAIYKEG